MTKVWPLGVPTSPGITAAAGATSAGAGAGVASGCVAAGVASVVCVAVGAVSPAGAGVAFGAAWPATRSSVNAAMDDKATSVGFETRTVYAGRMTVP